MKNIFEQKIEAFSDRACVLKAIEEAREYTQALEMLALLLEYPEWTRVRDMAAAIKHVFQEAADVHVSGYETLSRIWAIPADEYSRKMLQAITTDIPEAIAEQVRKTRKQQSNANN